MKTSKTKEQNSSKQFKIEANVIVPPKQRRGIYPWRLMNVGDSFFVEGDDSSVRSNVANCATSFSCRNKGYRFSIRKVPGGLRVWRVEDKRTEQSAERQTDV
jgi:hypothetical protein